MLQQSTQPGAAALPPVWPRAVGSLCLLVSLSASLLMVLDHFGGIKLPGCGPDSPCGKAAGSRWGAVPLLDWPVSSVGLAYFAAMLTAWWSGPPSGGAAFRWMARFGGAVSVFYLGLVVFGDYRCMYCVACHFGSLVFLGLLEYAGAAARRSGSEPRRAIRAAAVAPFVFAAVSGVLVVAEVRARAAARERDEQDLLRSTQNILSASTQPADKSKGFTARYRLGPERAQVRVVVFEDYQCPACKVVSKDLAEIVAKYPTVAAYAKHFPQNRDCNPLGSHSHSGACRSAQVAEAAGILRGNAGFWKVHPWLFERDGKFEDAQLHEFLRREGYDIAEFERTMASSTVKANIQADCADLKALGYSSTPAVFVNGESLHGWNAPGALLRVVEAVLATNPPALALEEDVLPEATRKVISEWQIIPPRTAPAPLNDWSRGPADAKAWVTVFTDFHAPDAKLMIDLVDAATASRPEVRVAFRHMPVHPDCNPTMRRPYSPNSCRTAYAAEAAGRLGGPEAFWRMVRWIVEDPQRFSDDALRAAGDALQLDPELLLMTMDDPDVHAAVVADAVAAKQVGIDRMPVVFVNDKWVAFWKQKDRDVLGPVIDAALRGDTEPPEISQAAFEASQDAGQGASQPAVGSDLPGPPLPPR